MIDKDIPTRIFEIVNGMDETLVNQVLDEVRDRVKQQKLKEIEVEEWKKKPYEEKIEGAWDGFISGMKWFAQGGDERDSITCFEEDTKINEIEKEIKNDKNKNIKKSYKNALLKDIQKKKKEAQRIEGLAETHRIEMQRHSSGSSYHKTLAEFTEAIGM